ncbi:MULTISPECIES: response regulator transcription factor [Planktothricoides]|uniref:Response regulator n=2 Tax=Planktothricoides raciborskii TaxID=132608 RepID=A0AAU8J9J7_9CYAN|nr:MULTISPECIES: response regulator [Planktothricoides]KOR37134.1 histidine kinase [Planktothricoides sp. SR001]MBD2546539.1 response regulator [Planktothricoides raciborskii FACHB-1370]MBD2580683.1 response regulator [Planktothricoides raciborskii FACHB-1261]
MLRILTIEDEENIRDTIVETLSMEGFEVIQAENGKVGLKLAQKHLPDLILCDVLMPELDGYDVLRQLNQNRQTQGIPFIFLTAKDTSDDFRYGMNLGANDYLMKPFTTQELVMAVKSRLQRYRME